LTKKQHIQTTSFAGSSLRTPLLQLALSADKLAGRRVSRQKQLRSAPGFLCIMRQARSRQVALAKAKVHASRITHLTTTRGGGGKDTTIYSKVSDNVTAKRGAALDETLEESFKPRRQGTRQGKEIEEGQEGGQEGGGESPASIYFVSFFWEKNKRFFCQSQHAYTQREKEINIMLSRKARLRHSR
jgi:hypothetical protein